MKFYFIFNFILQINKINIRRFVFNKYFEIEIDYLFFIIVVTMENKFY